MPKNKYKWIGYESHRLYYDLLSPHLQRLSFMCCSQGMKGSGCQSVICSLSLYLRIRYCTFESSFRREFHWEVSTRTSVTLLGCTVLRDELPMCGNYHGEQLLSVTYKDSGRISWRSRSKLESLYDCFCSSACKLVFSPSSKVQILSIYFTYDANYEWFVILVWNKTLQFFYKWTLWVKCFLLTSPYP